MKIISGKTCLVGLLGKPVAHSLSPVMQNAALKEMDLDWCYIAMPCDEENISNVLKALQHLNCQGLNITIPHKISAAKLCQKLSPIAKRLSAVNTLIPNNTGGWTGTNTDVEGFLFPLRSKKLEGKQAVVIGCGGSARAVVAGLQDRKLSQITVLGRNSNNLKNFLQDLKNNTEQEIQASTHLKGLIQTNNEIVNAIKEADLLINTTPVGMTSDLKKAIKSNEIPLNEEIWSNLSPNAILYDLIYTPKPTAWLALGKQYGCVTIDGLEMLIQQGAASLRLWSGREEIPIQAMRNAAENFLLT